ncbi:R3H domain-containing nucleic acid-binding protein [Terrabacter sp. Ter38]|uniref:Jag family protein n=1 Tax=Terrabacter sp. Ter38 TaxID=2926030 RepID=UPI00211770B3|nr:R3H domain-containing nucleic acid-binding protein [Terrabacter sp. Ter38]
MSDTQATDVETPTDATVEPDTGESTDQVTEIPESALAVEASEGGEVAEADASDQSSDAAADSDEADADDQGNQADRADKGDKKSRVRMLEREGEVAADFLETLLDIADLDGDIDVDVDGDRAAIAIVDSDEGRVPRRLVGTDGKVLEALQELTRLAVQVETGERSRLMLDIAGHRAQRRSALVELAKVAIAEVQESGTKRALEPMTAFERKVVHDEVAAAGLVSESEGVDPHRHIVILPA